MSASADRGPAVPAPAAMAQTTLRIGLAEDPDVLDPTLARTYVGRIVFASLCDKLFDIDDKLNIVPQLALSHETSEDGKTVTIKLRPGVKFHDGEAMDAEAVKASLERHMTMQGSFRKPELAAVDKVEVADASTVRLLLKSPFSPLIAQLADRAGMIVIAQGGARRRATSSASSRCAPVPSSSSSACSRIASSSRSSPTIGTRPTSTSTASFSGRSSKSTVRLANLKSGSLDLIERALATDLKEIRADPKLKLATQIEIGYQGLTLNLGQRRGRQERPLRQGPTRAPGAGSRHRPQGALRGRLQRRGAARQPVGQPQESLLPAASSRCRGAMWPRPRSCLPTPA